MASSSDAPLVGLTAPLTGVMVPIEVVPDPVFARKMVGEGFSIDPLSSRLLAPIAGEVADLQPSGHAVTIRSADGLEVLLHIGLDTVKMVGQGFTPLVKVGQPVKVGDPLIDFDMEAVAAEAKSLLTQVVIVNSEMVAELTPRTGVVTGGRDIAAEIRIAEPAAEGSGSAPGRTVTSEAILVPNPTGLHARPAATLANLAKSFTSDIRVRRGEDSANAKSIVAVMALAVARADKVTITAHGADADEAIARIGQAVKEGLGEQCPPVGTEDTAPMPALAPAVAPEPVRPRSGDPNVLVGVSASPGLGIGTVVQIRRQDFDIAEFANDHHKERRRLNTAIDRALLDLSALQRRLEEDADAERAAIFGAHQEILADPDLLDLATSAIDKGRSAPFAWRGAVDTYAQRLAGLTNEILAGRAADVRDVGRRVLEELTGQRGEKPELPTGTILVAEDLTPSDTAQLDRTKVVGFATTNGGASSHVAIIARSLDIPAVAGIEGRALSVAEGSQVVLDGTKGTLTLNLTDTELDAIRARQRRHAERRAADEAHKAEPAVTTDGHRVTVAANIASVEDAAPALAHGAEGIGLLRSELVFLSRTTAPDEAEQAGVYADCAKALGPSLPLVIRTLDVGGDKPLPYLPMPAEENPFLGMRGIRVGLENQELLRTQCRAILAAVGAGATIHAMFPMIATLEDWRAAKRIFDEERASVGGDPSVSVGIMMEVPSVGIMARQFAAEPGCDFFSVGTNDLTSYTLAMDRGHPKLAAQVDPCNPAVLTLIHQAAQALHEHGKWLGVCGGIASEVQAVPILVGLGVDELSCSIPAIPSVKAAVRARSLAECRDLAERALNCATPAEVRALVASDVD
ncbi:MAG: phosphoenolpyruvate--protein phosphotransferase [Dermatophilaceae bacterium]